MAEKLQIRLYLICNRPSWVLKVVEDMDLTASCLRRNDVVTLGHIASLVNLTCMVDLCLNRDSLVLWLTTGISSRLHDLIFSVLGRLERYLDLHDLYVVLFVIACVRSD